jgi:tripartite-type tricarboxylate transporter receptor subunit TctC
MPPEGGAPCPLADAAQHRLASRRPLAPAPPEPSRKEERPYAITHRPAPAGLVALVAATSSPAFAAGYPEKSIQYLIPFVAGGESDVVARLQQQVFSQKFKQEMVVVNRAGGGGALVWQQLTRCPATATIAGINLPHVAAAARGLGRLQDGRHDVGVLVPLHA